MKIWCHRSLFALLLFFGVSLAASEASDDYVSIYSLITKGDEMLESGLKGEAAQFYSDAHRKLVAFRNSYPDWNHQVVRFRLKYLGEKLVDLPSIEAESIQPSTPTNSKSEPVGTNLSGQNRMLEGQVAALNEQMRQLVADNSLLLSKLREAMSARPAEVDPSQVRKAEAKILELEKENELIELQLLRALKPKPVTMPARSAADDLKDSQELVARLLSENERLRAKETDQGLKNSKLTESIADLNRQIGLLAKDRDALKQQVDRQQ